MSPHVFTYDEANDLVPWLERIFGRMGENMERLTEVKERLANIRRRQERLNGTFDQHKEIQEMQDEIDQMDRGLQCLLDAMADAGIIIRDVSRGLVDFLHRREGREVYLCWVKGEKRIAFWHETDQGFDHRQPL